MDLTRRDVCAMGAGTAAFIAFGLPAGATEEATEAAIAELTGGGFFGTEKSFAQRAGRGRESRRGAAALGPAF